MPDIRLIPHDESKHGRTHAGPVDDEQCEWMPDLVCPDCGKDTIQLIPEQQGRCHAGTYPTAVLIDHFYCPDDNGNGCDAVFVDENDFRNS